MYCLGLEQFEFTLRMTTLVIPVALYFFILGFLNTRLHPQVLSGKQDFSILVATLSPLILGPLFGYFSNSPLFLILSLLFAAIAVCLVVPRHHSLIVYNMEMEECQHIVIRCLQEIGMSARYTDRGIEVDEKGVLVDLASFPILRSVTLRFGKLDGLDIKDLEKRIIRRIRSVDVVPRPTAVGFLLVSTCMMIVPMGLMIRHTPDIVRFMENLVK